MIDNYTVESSLFCYQNSYELRLLLGMKKKYILSLDGGGVRTIASITFLKKAMLKIVYGFSTQNLKLMTKLSLNLNICLLN